MKTQFLLLIIVFYSLCLWAQDPFPHYPPVYKDDIVSRVDIFLPPDSLAYIVAPGNEESNYHFHATFIFNNNLIRDTFENVGFQLRGNTSRYAEKKSFQVSLNTYVPGRKWYGIEKINLNGEHNDPTVSRSKIAWDLLRKIGVPAPRSSHVELYINNTYFGLYANVEHIDEEFVKTRFGNNDGNLYKCLWPADLKYLGDDPDLYKKESGGRRTYDLITNEEIDDYADLAHFIDVLNNTSVNELECELESIFNVNSFLLAMAADMLSGNWDGALYNKNNFYLYHNPETGLFEYIPYDLDNTFGIDWFGINWAERNIYMWGPQNETRPLYWKIVQVPEYKDRLSFFLNKIIDEYYKEAVLFPRIDSLKNLLSSYVAEDVYYTLDYGFDIDDFNKGFGQSLPFNHTPIGIKPFIATRRSSTISQLQINEIPPFIRNHETNIGGIFDQISIQVFIEDDYGIESVNAFIQWNGTGSLETFTMHDDGQHMDDEAGDGIYGLILPPAGECTTLDYSIITSDINGNDSRFPVCGTKLLEICTSSLTLVINEFMASNTTTIMDESGEFEDWIELYNYGPDPVYLGDRYLTDKPDNPVKWKFPDITIPPGEYIIIWADEDQEQGDLHTNFKLSADGEYIGLFDNDVSGNLVIDALDFGQQETDRSFGRIPNGNGPFQFLIPTPGEMNESSLSNEEHPTNHLRIYPNPAHDFFYFESDIPSEEPYQIVLLDMFGQIVGEKIMESRVMFQLNDLPSGMYLLCSKGEKGLSAVGTLIKK